MPTNLISLEQAIEMTTLFRKEKESILAEGYRGKNILPICETFGRDAFDTVLSQEGCIGLRIYYGMSDKAEIKAVIVGVSKNDEDMLPSAQKMEDGNGKGGIIEDSTRCPPFCPPPSVLNG